MSYADLNRRTQEEGFLHSVLLELTYRCNLDCSFCYNDLSLQGQPLELAQYETLLQELAELEVLHLTLSGGEPLASPHFWSIGARARELGFAVRVKTNGHAVRDGIARRLRDELDPFLLEISLHGARAETHDRQTRVAGSFDRLIANLRQMLDLGLHVKLNATLTRWNEGEVEAMLALADELGVRLAFDPVVTPRDDGDRSPLDLSASDGGVTHLMDVLRRRQSERLRQGLDRGFDLGRHNDIPTPGGDGGKACGTGSSTLAIDPFGNVYPCVQWRRAVGNLHHESLLDIWRGSAVLGEIRDAAAEAGRMLDTLGPEGRAIGFCLGLAHEHGEALGLYPDAKRRLAIERAPARFPILGQDV